MSDLLSAARTARANAWAPYSGFAVGAALRAASGRIFAGCNVENAAYPQSQCAEATAIGCMVAAGDRRIVEILVLGSGGGPCTPCGGCRQRLAEFAPPETPIEIWSPDRLHLRTTLGDLLPHSFTFRAGADPHIQGAESVIRNQARGFAPSVGIALGSGLGAVAQMIHPVASIAYQDLPGFPRPSVPGHAGRLLLGRLAGVAVACLQGRLHLYEGRPASEISIPIRVLRALGCEILVLTNAVGSLRSDLGPGALVLIEDHINLQGTNPLVGRNDDRIGPRFPDLNDLYDGELRSRVTNAAGRCEIELRSGTLAGWLGPCFETPAEIRMLRSLGADIVGMSVVSEAIAARHCGLRVVGLSVVTNLAAGMSRDPLTHEATLAQADRASERVMRLLEECLPDLVR